VLPSNKRVFRLTPPASLLRIAEYCEKLRGNGLVSTVEPADS
jgi:hypothetical protein